MHCVRSPFRRVHGPTLSIPLLALALLVPAQLGAAGPEHYLTPKQALETFQIEPGLRIELVAAEPLVVDPVAFAFDEKQRLYVVENRGYPDPLQSSDEPKTTIGRVALLEDTDGDGRYDRRHEFATGLGYPNGIAVWRGGVFVTAAPDVLYLKDHDGDGVADERRVVLTGFEDSKTAQIRVCYPTLALDGWMYLACGRNGGKVTSPEHPSRPPVEFDPVDSRFGPDSLLFELVGGSSQFGLTFDFFGRRFGVRNRHPVLHTVLEPRYLSRNPYLTFNNTVQEVSKVQDEAKVYPISQAKPTTFWADIYRPDPKRISHDGTFTSACGPLIFGGTGLGPEHVGNAFACEPAQNLVQRQVFHPAGASFRTDLPYTGREFLASTDVAFRPVFLGTGPDGAIYVADMYRYQIDHPQYVPAMARPQIDFVGPHGTGRIYRIVKEAKRVTTPVVTTIGDLCRHLESADSWWRDTAFRLLLERADPAAVPLLERLATGAVRPESRAQALWLLRAHDRISRPLLAKALRDPHPGVREQAIWLAEAASDLSAGLLEPLLAMAQDPDARVRFVAALVLGSFEDSRVTSALAAISLRDGEDPWTRAAVLSGIGSRIEPFLASLNAARSGSSTGFTALMPDLSRVFGAGASLESCRRLIAQMLAEDRELAWCLPGVMNLAEGMRGRTDLAVNRVGNPLPLILPGDALDDFFRRIAVLARNEHASLEQRVSAVTLLSQSDYQRAGPLFGELLDPSQPVALQLQAVRAIERLGDPRGGAVLLDESRWKGYAPQVRAAVISALTSKPALVTVLFEAVGRGVVKPSEIPSVRRAQLLKHPDPKVREGAQAVLAKLEGGDRMQVFRAYRDILHGRRDTALGAEPFARVCATCHTYNGVGGKVGPDLTGVRNQSEEALLLHILVPNYEITPGYEAVSVTTRDGRTLSGLLASESENSLTLRTPFGTEETLPRSNVGSFVKSGISLMPDGLEMIVSPEELANIVAYIKHGADAPPAAVSAH